MAYVLGMAVTLPKCIFSTPFFDMLAIQTILTINKISIFFFEKEFHFKEMWKKN